MLALAGHINIFGRAPVDLSPSASTARQTPAGPESRATAAALPIEDYDRLNVETVGRRLVGLRAEELERLRDYEAENKNRRRLMARIERRIKAARRATTLVASTETNRS
ncbi:MAG: hypothetical protein JOZ19_16835 [Rubrobacter sp.]|nr:hypothetical protein [Rubrobacter sp.]